MEEQAVGLQQLLIALILSLVSLYILIKTRKMSGERRLVMICVGVGLALIGIAFACNGASLAGQ